MAQTVKDPPPKIEFAQWRLVDQQFGMRRYSMSFPSPMTTGIVENDRVELDIHLPLATTPANAVVILHYWGAQNHRVEVGTAAELARRGIAGIVISLPYHMERTPAGVRSGDLAITPDPEKLKATMIQSIQDIRRVVDWIQTRPEFHQDRIGITGSSLGAIVAALAIAVEPRFTDAAFVVGGADIAGILWNSSRVVKERDVLRRQGFTEGKLRDALVEIEPLTYLSSRPPISSYVVAAKHDTVVPMEASRKLIDALPQPDVLWLDTGHYGGFFIQKRVQRSIGSFFAASFQDRPFDPPKSMNAPTIRLGVALESREGVQICAGLDLIRANRPSDPFASLLATPRGMQLAVGATLDRGLAVGAFIRPKQISFGVIWSIVL